MLPNFLRRAALVAVLSAGLACDDMDPAADPSTTIDLSAAEVLLTEGAAPETLSVTLSAAPAEELTVTLTATAGVTLAPTTLHFSPADHATPQQVVVTPHDDEDVVAHYDTITVMAAGLDPVTAAVTTTDDDYVAIIATHEILAFEEGDTIQLGVSLSRRPPGELVVEVGLPPNFPVRLSTDSITFTPGNYATPVVVTLIADPDVDVVNDSTLLQLAAPATPLVEIPVKVADVDTMQIVVDPVSLLLDEGDTVTVRVSLSHRPIGPVQLSVTSLDTTALVLVPAQLTIDPGGYNVPVDVFMVAREDADQNGEITQVRILLAGVDTALVGIRINDNDDLAITVDDNEQTVAVGDSVTVNVSLNSFNLSPTDSVVVTVQSQTPGIVTAGPASLIFTAADFGTPVPIKLKGVAPGGAIRGVVSLTAPNYDAAVVLVDVI